MSDTGINIKEFADTVLSSERTANLLISGVFFGFCRGDMVEHNSEAFGIKESGCTNLVHNTDRSPRGRVTHDEVRIRLNDFARPDSRESGLRRKDFLGDRHAHKGVSSRKVYPIVYPLSKRQTMLSPNSR